MLCYFARSVCMWVHLVQHSLISPGVTESIAQLDVKKFEEGYVCNGCFRDFDKVQTSDIVGWIERQHPDQAAHLLPTTPLPSRTNQTPIYTYRLKFKEGCVCKGCFKELDKVQTWTLLDELKGILTKRHTSFLPHHALGARIRLQY